MNTLLSLLLAARVIVISHRGEHLAHPENTLLAFQAAIEAGADFFELDVRTTSDGKLVLMHDATVDRTTNGKGLVRQMAFDQIRRLDAGAKFGPQFAGTKVPTFEEALRLAHGKIGIYVDCKEIAPGDLASALETADMLDKVVIYGSADFLRSVLAVRPSLKVMPEADSGARLQKLITDLNLRAAAFNAGDFKDEVLAIAKEAHVDIYVDRLGAADNVDHWQDAIDRGAAGIQTDKPADLVQYLRQHKLHK
jgi:glycerophosphoryl diester phosphodiesterase